MKPSHQYKRANNKTKMNLTVTSGQANEKI